MGDFIKRTFGEKTIATDGEGSILKVNRTFMDENLDEHHGFCVKSMVVAITTQYTKQNDIDLSGCVTIGDVVTEVNGLEA